MSDNTFALTNDTYTLLGFFEAAFQRVGAVNCIINIDCTTTKRSAEGQYKGKPWSIYAMPGKKVRNKEHLQLAYRQVGEYLLVPLYEEITKQLKSEGAGEAEVHTMMQPVLEAMSFNFGMAAEQCWLSRTEVGYKGQPERGEGPSLAEAVEWTNLKQVGLWTTMELMEMLVRLDSGFREHQLSGAMREEWVQAHVPDHRAIAKQVLDTAFAIQDGGVGVDAHVQAQAWKAWWTMLGPTVVANPIFRLMDQWLENQHQAQACLAGWYLSVAESTQAREACLHGVEDNYYHLDRPGTWLSVRRYVRRVVQEYPEVVWANDDVQAWFLHRCHAKLGVLDTVPAMLNNRAHDYIRMHQTLDPSQDTRHLYALWKQTCGFSPKNDVLDVNNLLEPASLP